jgi:hypothetical protein
MRKTRQAFLLPFTLALLFILMTLCLGLSYSSQQSLIGSLFEQRNNGYEMMLTNVVEDTGIAACDPTSIPATKGTVKDSRTDLSMQWVVDHRALLDDPFQGKGLGFAHGDPLPKTGYSVQRQVFNKAFSLPEESSAVVIQGAHSRYRAVLTAGFPFAVYAPRGSIEVGKVGAVTNSNFDGVNGETTPDEASPSGLPVLLRARSKVETGHFPHGRAYSDLGPIQFGEGSRAIPRLRSGGEGGDLAPDLYLDGLGQRLDYARTELLAGTVKKSQFIYSTGPVMSIEQVVKFSTELSKLIKGGDKDAFQRRIGDQLLSFGTVQQAMVTPFFPLVTGSFSLEPPIGKIEFHPNFPPDTSNDAMMVASEALEHQMKFLSSTLNAMSDFFGGGFVVDLVVRSIEYAVSHDGKPPSGRMVEKWFWDYFTNHPADFTKALKKIVDAGYDLNKNVLKDLVNSIAVLTHVEDIIQFIHRILGFSKEIMKMARGEEKFAMEKLIKWGLIMPPVSQQDEEDYRSHFMQKGWSLIWPFAYLLETGIDGLFVTLPKNLKHLVSADPKEVKQGIYGIFQGFMNLTHVKTRMVHFNGTRPDFYFPDGLPDISDLQLWTRPNQIPGSMLSMKGTWTVPPGRTTKLTEDVQIRGDLWLQRGSVFYVDGDLLVSKPERLEDEMDPWPDYKKQEEPWDAIRRVKGLPLTHPDSPKPAAEILKPRGRVIMEPGTTLIVDGNLTIEGGDAAGGSLVICSRYGGVAPITTAVLCEKDVTLKYGTGSGILLRDLIRQLDNRQSGKTQSKWGDLLDFVETQMSPNMAKLAGPFEVRKSFFAAYPSSILIIVVDGAPIPFPATLPGVNVNNVIFDVGSLFYAVELNSFLGENLFTHSPWWPHGRGVVPVMPKIPITKDLVHSWTPTPVKDIAEAGFEHMLDDYITKELPELMGTVVILVVETFIDLLMEEVMGQSTGETESTVESLVDKIITTTVKAISELLSDTLLDTLETTTAKCANLMGEIGQSMTDPAVAGSLLKELPGVLLYTGGNLTVTSKEAVAMVGMFVAEDDLTINAKLTLGSVISRSGDVKLNEIHYYPYYTRPVLYEPLKPKHKAFHQKVPVVFEGITDAYTQALQFDIPERGKADEFTYPIFVPAYQISAEGWSQ